MWYNTNYHQRHNTNNFFCFECEKDDLENEIEYLLLQMHLMSLWRGKCGRSVWVLLRSPSRDIYLLNLKVCCIPHPYFRTITCCWYFISFCCCEGNFSKVSWEMYKWFILDVHNNNNPHLNLTLILSSNQESYRKRSLSNKSIILRSWWILHKSVFLSYRHPSDVILSNAYVFM